MEGLFGEISAWLHRAEAFVRGLNRLPGRWGISVSVSPPLSHADADDLAKQLPLGLPGPLRELYTAGSANFKCRYHWTPHGPPLEEAQAIFPHEQSYFGGAEFIPCTELGDAHGLHSWWESGDGQVPPDNQQAWEAFRRSIPFIHVGNGDHVALQITDDPKQLPVVYLCHDDVEHAVTPLSRSLGQFLTDWESLGYIGPEIWLLNSFLGNEGLGPIVIDQRADRWRELLLRGF